ncbi:MAG: ATP cone domain-containing protein, partial [Planctomycetota bacterium]
LRVVKKDGARELFSPEKIRQGIQRACWKRPIETDKVEQAITEIVQEIYDLGMTEIDSQTIGEMAMEKLVDLDDVAYIRFASVYRQFKDIHDFVAEVRPILDRNQLRVESSKK